MLVVRVGGGGGRGRMIGGKLGKGDKGWKCEFQFSPCVFFGSKILHSSVDIMK